MKLCHHRPGLRFPTPHVSTLSAFRPFAISSLPRPARYSLKTRRTILARSGMSSAPAYAIRALDP